MCDQCGWRLTVDAIDADLETRIVGHTALVLEKAALIIVGNQHVTQQQREAIETVLEQRQGATS